MAIIYCPKCKNPFSDQRRICPYCGVPKIKKRRTLKRKINKFLILIIVAIASIALLLSGHFFIVNKNYNKAMDLLDDRQYKKAIDIFESLGNYRDAPEKIIQSERLYGVTMDGVISAINIETIIAQMVCDLISDTWSSAIDSKSDFNKEIALLLNRLEEEAAKDGNNYTLVEEIDDLMKVINNPIADYVATYDMVLELYGIYIQIYSQSINPTGSLITFNQEIKSLSSEYDKIYNKIKIIKPEIEVIPDEDIELYY